jgi:signal transduction histidine kinase
LNGIIEIKLEKKQDKTLLHIIDNGIGISEDKKNKIFDPFFTSKEVGKGTGLGLSLSYNLIQKHGGDVTFSSQVMQGTEFIIELPSYTDLNLYIFI